MTDAVTTYPLEGFAAAPSWSSRTYHDADNNTVGFEAHPTDAALAALAPHDYKWLPNLTRTDVYEVDAATATMTYRPGPTKIAVHDGVDALYLLPDEARQLAAFLLKLADVADGNTELPAEQVHDKGGDQ